MDVKNEIDIDELISQMTLKEKVGQLNQHLYGWQCYYKNDQGEYELTEIFKNHIKEFGGVGAIYGILRADAWSGRNEINGVKKEDSLKVIQMIQQYIQENTRLKIPALITEECVHGHQGLHSMMYPSNISMGMTWNDELLQKICQQVSQELESKGGNLALYTALDVMRDPRWGRTEECYSEDPYLSSQMAQASVKGFQHSPNQRVGVILKHMCAQGSASGGHNSGAANIGVRELREIFLPPVESGVKAKAKGVMAAYNEIDGIPCHVNKELIEGILRKEYGFDGIVMADGCALDRILIMNPSPSQAASMACQAGIDLSLWDNIYTHLDQAVLNNELDEEIINQRVKNILKLKYDLNLFEPQKEIQYDASQEKELSLQAARECQVLLKNDGILPLDKKKKKIAIIGPNAHNKLNMLGDYSSFQKEEDIITIYEGLQMLNDGHLDIRYEKGCEIRSTEGQFLQKAVELAQSSDIVILALGGSSARSFKMKFESNGAVKTSYDKHEMNCGENVDMASIDLDGIQTKLLKEIHKVNENIITVLIQGRPHSITDVVLNSRAIISAWYPGSLGGLAIAETIFGDNNPSGKLSMSIPQSSSQLPCFYNEKYSGAKEDYIDMTGKPLYPFGYGLSYSEFEYFNITLSKESVSIEELDDNGIDIELIVENKSHRNGKDVIQVYIIDCESSITRRKKELKAYKKVFVDAFEKKQVKIHLDGNAFKIWDYQMNHVIEPGHVQILVGKNSEEFVIKELYIKK